MIQPQALFPMAISVAADAAQKQVAPSYEVTVHLGAPPGFATPASAAWQAIAHQDRIHLRQNGGCKPPLSEIGERLRYERACHRPIHSAAALGSSASAPWCIVGSGSDSMNNEP
jgi:hypothetical protein